MPAATAGQGLWVERPGSRQRLLDALRHRFTGEVPFFECYVAAPVVDQVMGRPMGARHMLQLDIPDYLEFIQRTAMDAAYIYEGWFLGRNNVYDERGQPQYVDGTIKSRSDFDQIRPPSLDRVRRRVEGWVEAARDTGIGCVGALDEAPALAYTAIGPTDFLLAMHDDPGFVDELMDRVEEYTLPLVECFLDYPIDALFTTGPFCGRAGPIFSPEIHERFVFPRIEKVVRMVRPRNLPLILHVDGDGSRFLDWILRMGFAGLHPIEPGCRRWDIYDLKRNYGNRICLLGNIDVGTVLSSGTPEEVRADTLEHLRRLAPGAGYVCGSSHDISENVPLENFAALARTICTYRHPAGESP